MQRRYHPEQAQRPGRNRGGFTTKLLRFLRGYLMTVGTLTTLYVLARFVVWLLVKMNMFF